MGGAFDWGTVMALAPGTSEGAKLMDSGTATAILARPVRTPVTVYVPSGLIGLEETRLSGSKNEIVPAVSGRPLNLTVPETLPVPRPQPAASRVRASTPRPAAGRTPGRVQRPIMSRSLRR